MGSRTQLTDRQRARAAAAAVEQVRDTLATIRRSRRRATESSG